MQRELLPKIHEETLESYICYLGRSQSEVDRLKHRIDRRLENNYGLRDFIELMQHISTDPDGVTETAYGILALIIDQKEIDELNEQAKLVYRDKISTSILDNYFAETSDFLGDSLHKRSGGNK